jgi:hypothetical protein
MKRTNQWFLGCLAVISVFFTQAASARAGSAVILNEVLANNVSYTDIDGDTPDWIELYNPSDADINLVGLYLSNDTANPKKWAFREGSKIKAKSFLVVYCDSGLAEGTLNTGFSLNTDGDSLCLYDDSTNLVDSVTFGMQVPDFSIGRAQTATSTWGLCKPTMNGANEAATLGPVSGLRLNEWMAEPESGDDWFEIYNPSAYPVALGGLYLTDDISSPTLFTVSSLCFIGTGANGYVKFHASKKPENGPNHTNFKLSKSGSFLGLAASSGYLDKVTFGTQTLGVSQGRLPDGASTWAYFTKTPSPAESNHLPLSTVVVNEILSHTDEPEEDAVELYNASEAAVSIGGWTLTDSQANWKKYAIPAGTTIASHSYLVFYNHDFGGTNAATPFSLNSSEGDSVYLCMVDSAGALTGYRSDASFGAAPNGTSFGRYTNSVSEVTYPLQKALTLGAINAGPRIGPIVVSEIMYHPVSLVTNIDNTTDEYIELYNITAATALLHHATETTNTWHLRGGVKFDFPEDISLAAGGRLLIVNFDPTNNPTQLAAFRAKFNVPASVPIFGPYEGKLSNSGDKVTLEAPDTIQGNAHVNEGFVPYYVVDRVEYTDASPWPAAADGSGSALQCKEAGAYANDPANWMAASPLPGRAKSSSADDADGDGMLDTWETANGLSPENASDANLDADGDGMTNLQEYLAGTNPRSATSLLGYDSIQSSNGTVKLTFTAVAGKNYVAQYRDSMDQGAWLQLSEITNATAGTATVTDSNPPASGIRFYRLILNY